MEISKTRAGTAETGSWEIPPILRNFHLWVILVMIVILSFFYYLGFPSLRDNAGWLWSVRVFEFRYHINGSLFYIPFMYSVIAFNWVGLAVCGTACLLIMVPRIFLYSYSFTAFSNNVTFLIAPPMVVILQVRRLSPLMIQALA